MALRNCLYCNKRIYEFVTTCPHCKNEAPFNEGKKAEKELVNKINKKLNELDISIKCQECGHPINIPISGNQSLKVLEEGVTIQIGECQNCGFPRNEIKCFICNEGAIYYDPIQEDFACFKHFTAKCLDCGKLVLGVDKKYRRCESCYKKFRFSIAMKDFTDIFIERPLAFGFLGWIIFGFSGCLVRAPEFMPIGNLFKSYIREGFLGLAIGVVGAILYGIYRKKEYLNKLQ